MSTCQENIAMNIAFLNAYTYTHALHQCLDAKKEGKRHSTGATRFHSTHALGTQGSGIAKLLELIYSYIK